jgi:hypothetical protein
MVSESIPSLEEAYLGLKLLERVSQGCQISFIMVLACGGFQTPLPF